MNTHGQILFAPREDFWFSDNVGEITMTAADVESAICQWADNRPHDRSCMVDILEWVKAVRLNNADVPEKFPELWARAFSEIVGPLLAAGKARAHCTRCHADIPTSAIKVESTGISGSWAFMQSKCPSGHPLVTVEAMHFMWKHND